MTPHLLALSAGRSRAHPHRRPQRGARSDARRQQQHSSSRRPLRVAPAAAADAARPATQTTPSVVGTGTISGAVVLEGTGSGVRRARVTLSGTELRGGRTAITDDQGRFAFTALPAGRFTMTASKAGFVDIAYGAKRSGRPGTPIQLSDGQKIEKAVIALPRGSVVTGVVIDENGEPSPGTRVRVMRYVIRTGERSLSSAGEDTTDDRGMYRVYGLQPGEYMISAVPRNASLGDLRQTIQAEVESLMQQLQSQGVTTTGGRGGGGRGGETARPARRAGRTRRRPADSSIA